jgi:sulfur carrier protein
MSIADYLLSEGYVLSHIAVERNEVIVSKKDYADTRIQDGDVIEIVQFMGGG